MCKEKVNELEKQLKELVEKKKVTFDKWRACKGEIMKLKRFHRININKIYQDDKITDKDGAFLQLTKKHEKDLLKYTKIMTDLTDQLNELLKKIKEIEPKLITKRENLTKSISKGINSMDTNKSVKGVVDDINNRIKWPENPYLFKGLGNFKERIMDPYISLDKEIKFICSNKGSFGEEIFKSVQDLKSDCVRQLYIYRKHKEDADKIVNDKNYKIKLDFTGALARKAKSTAKKKSDFLTTKIQAVKKVQEGMEGFEFILSRDEIAPDLKKLASISVTDSKSEGKTELVGKIAKNLDKLVTLCPEECHKVLDAITSSGAVSIENLLVLLSAARQGTKKLSESIVKSKVSDQDELDKLVHQLIQQEAEQSESVGTFFRSNCQASSIMTSVTKVDTECVKHANQIGDSLFDELKDLKKSVEVDPKKLKLDPKGKSKARMVEDLNMEIIRGDPKLKKLYDKSGFEEVLIEVKKRPEYIKRKQEIDKKFEPLELEGFKFVVGIANKIFSDVLNSDPPRAICLMAFQISNGYKSKFGDDNPSEILKMVGGVYMLRYLCPKFFPGIATKLLKEKKNSDGQRVVSILAKLFQNLSNRVHATKKEPYMGMFTGWIKDNQKYLDDFYNKMILLGEKYAGKS